MRRAYAVLFTISAIALATFLGIQAVHADNQGVFTLISVGTASCNVAGNGGGIAITWENNNNGGDTLTIYRSTVSGGVVGGTDGGPWTQIAVISGKDPRLSPSKSANPITYYDVSTSFVKGQTYYYKLFESHQGNPGGTLQYGSTVFAGATTCLTPTVTTLNQPSVAGGDTTVSLTATVTYGNNLPVPSGKVVFKIFDTTNSPAQLIASTDPLNPVPAANGQTISVSNGTTVPVSVSIGNPGFDATHTYTTEADYSDGPTYGSSVGYGTIAVNENPTQLIVTPVSAVYGTANITLSALLTNVANPSIPVGVAGETVSFTLNGTPVCGVAALPSCPVTADGTNGTTLGLASITVPLPASISAGDYATGIGASFAGDNNYGPSNGTGDLNITTTGVTVTIASDSPLIGTVQTSTFGQAVTLTVGATSPAGTPTGTISVEVFQDLAGTLEFNPPIKATVTLSNGSGTLGPLYFLPIGGPRMVVATYSGDVNFSGGETASLIHQVIPDPTTTTVTSSSSNNTSNYGDSVTLTATVAGVPPSSGPNGFQPTAAPTGTVTFYDAASGATCASLGASTSLGSASASGSNSSSTASISTSTLSVAQHTILACYPGDTNYGSSSGTMQQTVNKATVTVTVLSDSPNLNNVQTSEFGESVTLSVGATSNAGTPTGTITVEVFQDQAGTLEFNPPIKATSTYDGTKWPKIGPIYGLPIGGPRKVLATYSGDANFATGTAYLIHAVVPDPTTTVLTSSSPSNTSTYGSAVTFTATVSDTAPTTAPFAFNPSPTQTGTVRFYDGGTCLADGTSSTGTLLDTKSLSTGSLTTTNAVGADSGAETITHIAVSTTTSATGLSAGAHGVVACYGGDTNFAASNGSVTQTVNQASLTVTAGSYSGTYDGNTHALSDCTVSTNPDGLTCTNSPVGPVGPDATAAPVTVTAVVSGSTANYSVTTNNGSYSITPMPVTITGGSYSATYDGNSHPPSACTSSAATFVTCTNGPASVGPGIGSGDVTPTANYVQGNANDYTITPKNGSWSITAAKLTVTAGSYSGTYDGSTHALSACTVSTNPDGLTCTNNPAGPVGPDVGGATVVPVMSGSTANYSVTTNNGSWSITKAVVTVTAGGYSGTYDGTQHALSACAITGDYHGGLTCTNSPLGPVGADVSSGTVTPQITGNTNDYTITPANGSYSIGKMPVTLTAGSYTGVYDGLTHAPAPACSSSAPTFVTCTNSPSSVGAAVGSGSVTATPSYVKGIAGDYSIAAPPGAWSITPLADTATVTITTGKGNVAGVPTVQYSDLVGINVSIPIVGGINPLNACPNNNSVAACVKVTIGAQVFTINLNASGGYLTGSVSNQQLFDAPGSQPVALVVGNGTNGLSAVNANYTVTPAYVPNGGTPAASLNVNVTQEDALVTYTGQTFFSVASTVTSVTIPVSYTLKDATASGVNSIYDANAGDITKTGPVNITLVGQYYNASNGTFGNFSSACNAVPISAVPNATDPTNGLPSTATSGTCQFANVPVNGNYQLTISPGTGSYYTFPSGVGDTVVTIGVSNGGGGFITGGGYQTSSYLGSLGALKIAPNTVLGTLSGKTNFGFTAKYNKSGTNLQASVNIITRTTCMSSQTAAGLGYPNYAPHPGDDGLCLYQIKSNKVISMSDQPFLSATSPGYGVLIVGANIQDVTQPTAQALMGGGTLQLVMYDNSEPGVGKDTITFQVTDSKGTLWFSTSWNGTTTQIFNGAQTNSGTNYAPVINGGNLQVH